MTSSEFPPEIEKLISKLDDVVREGELGADAVPVLAALCGRYVARGAGRSIDRGLDIAGNIMRLAAHAEAGRLH